MTSAPSRSSLPSARRSTCGTRRPPPPPTGSRSGPTAPTCRDPDSYRRRSELMAADITAQLTVATRVGGDAPVPVPSGAPSEYLPLDPVRVLDTRRPPGARLAAGGVQTIALAGLVPPGARAVAVSLTSADPAAQGFLTRRRLRSAAGRIVGETTRPVEPALAFAVVPLDADGRLCVYSSAATDLIVDLQGAFVGQDAPVEEATRFTPRAPERLVDTRATGRASMLAMAAPAGSSGVAINLTATGASAQGYLTAFPCGGTVPVVSNVNFLGGETIAGSAFVPVGVDGTVCVFSSVAGRRDRRSHGHVRARRRARPTRRPAPTRVFDTRNAIGGWSPVQGIGQTIDVRATPDTAVAVTGTVTMVGPPGAGFATVFGCGAVPPTSNVNVAGVRCSPTRSRQVWPRRDGCAFAPRRCPTCCSTCRGGGPRRRSMPLVTRHWPTSSRAGRPGTVVTCTSQSSGGIR